MRFPANAVRCVLLLCLYGMGAVGGQNHTASATAPAPLQAPAAAGPDVRESTFIFEGGRLPDFLAKIKSTFKVDLAELATIDQMMWNVSLPKMKVQVFGATSDWERVLRAYNRMSEETDNRFGKWVLAREGPFLVTSKDYSPPSAILLIAPEHKQQQGKLLIKAFSLAGLSEQDREQMMRTLESEVDRLRGTIRESRAFSNLATEDDLIGTVSYHPQSGIMVVSGAPAYVECASSLVSAYKEMGRLRPPSSSPPKPEADPKPAPAK